MKYQDLTIGDIDEIVSWMGGMRGVQDWKDGKLEISRRPDFSPIHLGRITVGRPDEASAKCHADAIVAHIAERTSTSPEARSLLSHVNVMPENQRRIPICVINLQHMRLGANVEHSYKHIRESTLRAGFELCSLEVICTILYELRDELKELSSNKGNSVLYFASSPFFDEDHNPMILAYDPLDKEYEIRLVSANPGERIWGLKHDFIVIGK